MKRILLTSLLALSLAGCATSIKNLAQYTPSPLLQADVMPVAEQLESRRIKVVVFDADDSAVAKIGTGATMTSAIKQKISESSVEVVDRTLAMQLGDELNLAEARGAGSYSGPAVANVAIKSSVDHVRYGQSFVRAQRVCDKKGRCSMSPAYCDHSASMTGVVRLYEIPSLRLLSSITVSGSASHRTESYCQRSSDLTNTLIRQATANSIHSARTTLKNHFAPKGYVVEKQMFENKIIFKVMIGSDHGAKSQDKLTIYTIRKTENPLTNKVSFDEIPLLEGTISDQIAKDYAWIVPDDLEKAKKVRLGDYVKVVYKSGLF